MSSMTRLKNSFATAFAPVLTVVAPIMSRFIDMISRAITYVGMFAAALTGQDTFVKAVGVQEDYAAGLEKTSKIRIRQLKIPRRPIKKQKDIFLLLMRSNGIHRIKMMIRQQMEMA